MLLLLLPFVPPVLVCILLPVCLAGYGQQGGSSECTPCNFGSYHPGGDTKCTLCPAAKFYAPVDGAGDIWESQGARVLSSGLGLTAEGAKPQTLQD